MKNIITVHKDTVSLKRYDENDNMVFQAEGDVDTVLDALEGQTECSYDTVNEDGNPLLIPYELPREIEELQVDLIYDYMGIDKTDPQSSPEMYL